MKPRLRIEQKITAFVNQYRIMAIDEGDRSGNLVAFAQQKRAKLREEILFYADEAKTELICTLKAEKVFDVHGAYLVTASDGSTLGSFKKDFKKSLLSSTWHMNDASGNLVATVQESNMVLAVLRRFAGFIPFVGDLVDILLALIKYHFVFLDPSSSQETGRFQKITLFRDHYELSSTDELYDSVDWRVFAAMCVGLDALQSR